MAARIFDFRSGDGVTDASAEFAAPRTGRIVHMDEHGQLSVEFAGSRGAVLARLGLAVARERLEQARESGQRVVLLFEEGDPQRPIVVGLIEGVPPPAPEVQSEVGRNAPPLAIDVDADGRRARVTASEQIVFRCGKASVTLMSSGRVIVRGTYIETCASETNRIKGGRVRIN